VVPRRHSHLMEAEAVLDCATNAINDDLRTDAKGPHYPTLVRIARDFVHSTIDQLDSVSLRVATENNDRGVKEPSEQYTR
jgi:hypothetical protein